MDFFLRVLLLVVPLYIANSSAMLLGGKTALDFGKNFVDRKEIFGKGKTWKGTVFGILAGTVTSGLIMVIMPTQTTEIAQNYFFLGFLLSTGAIIGDLTGSFLKRRLSVKRGEPVFFLDQLDFIAGGLALGSVALVPTVKEILFIVALTLVAHKLSNFVAYKIKLKKVPW